MNKIIVREIHEESPEKSSLYATMGTLLSLVIVAGVAYCVWFLIGKILPILAILYLVIIAIVELKNLFTGWKYVPAVPASLKSVIDNGVEKATAVAKENDIETDETTTKGYAVLLWGVMLITILVMLAHYTITGILFITFGSSHIGYIGYLGFALVIWNFLRVIFMTRKVFYVFKHADQTPEDKGPVSYWIWNMVSKLRSTLTLLFLVGLIALNFGIM